MHWMSLWSSKMTLRFQVLSMCWKGPLCFISYTKSVHFESHFQLQNWLTKIAPSWVHILIHLQSALLHLICTYTPPLFLKGGIEKHLVGDFPIFSWYRVNQETCAVLLLSKRKGNRKPLPSFWSSLEGKSFICIPSTQHFNYGQWFWNSWAFREQRIRHSWGLIRNAFRIQNMNSLNTMISTLHWGKRIKLSKFTITFLKS